MSRGMSQSQAAEHFSDTQRERAANPVRKAGALPPLPQPTFGRHYAEHGKLERPPTATGHTYAQGWADAVARMLERLQATVDSGDGGAVDVAVVRQLMADFKH